MTSGECFHPVARAGLLSGTGQRHRHVRLTRPAGVEAPALRELLQAAMGARQ